MAVRSRATATQRSTRHRQARPTIGSSLGHRGSSSGSDDDAISDASSYTASDEEFRRTKWLTKRSVAQAVRYDLSEAGNYDFRPSACC